MRISISNNTSSHISCDVATIPPAGRLIISVEDDKLDNVLSELQKLGTSVTYRLLDQTASVRSISEPLTLYVTTDGDDSNSGTVRDPFKTIQAALDSLKGVEIEAAVTIKVGTGNFAGFATPGGIGMGQSGTLTIEGTLNIVDSGNATGFATVDGFFNVIDTSKTWTTDEHVGRFLQWTTNTGFAVNQPIGANSATQISVSTNTTSFGTGVTAYEIAAIGTFITSVATASAITTSNIVLSSVGAARTLASGFTIKYIESASNAGVSVRWGAYATFSGCAIRGAITLVSGCSLAITNCYLSGGTLSSSSCISVASTINSTTGISIAQSVLSVSGTGTGISLNCTDGTSTSCSLVQIRCSGGTGVNIVGGQMALLVGGVWGATTAVRAHQSALVISPSVLLANSSCILYGTGNTTVIDCTKGSRVSVSSTSTITGTTEISVDGVTSTIAAMRALTPKVFPGTPNAYGSYVYE